VEGRLIIASGEVTLILLKLLEPLWKATEGYNTIVVLPMRRFTTASCCRDKDHLTNRTEPDFEEKISKGLDEARVTIKRFMSGNSMVNYQVMDPNVDLAQLDKKMA
jgi:hypothetical protein